MWTPTFRSIWILLCQYADYGFALFCLYIFSHTFPMGKSICWTGKEEACTGRTGIPANNNILEMMMLEPNDWPPGAPPGLIKSTAGGRSFMKPHA